ncbi:hypothetical protein FA13DRAFT_1734576 [Coprinellus micaceus]|uniref:Uncharacterized protein n=1 Tax=Coprinellus micaceus TaxID=71717 RepID=A0A4Y7T5J2_COPMI|nr:hypothetical protein FA13DRAFT_1734576 [Coprinellus micaceus]
MMARSALLTLPSWCGKEMLDRIGGKSAETLELTSHYGCSDTGPIQTFRLGGRPAGL